jgi:hypothetical protein
MTVPDDVSFVKTLYEGASNPFGFPSNAISSRESIAKCSKLCDLGISWYIYERNPVQFLTRTNLNLSMLRGL